MGEPDSPAHAEEPVDVAALQAHCAELERQLAEAYAQQDALREVLRIIASGPTDLTSVFEAIAENAFRLSHFTGAGIWRVEGHELVRVGFVGDRTSPRSAPRPLGERMPINRDTLQGQA